MRARLTLGMGLVAMALLLALASLANPHDDRPPITQDSPPGHHYGWDENGNPHADSPAPEDTPAAPRPQDPLTPQAGAGIYTSDYYAGDGPIHLSGSELRRALGADARRPQ